MGGLDYTSSWPGIAVKDGVAYARLYPGHPRIASSALRKTWMPGTSSAKTRFALLPGHDERKDRGLLERLNRQPVLLRQFLQRNLRPCPDMLDHFGGGECAEAAGIFMTGVAHQAEQESGGEQVAGARGVDEFFDRECRRRDDAVFRGYHA